MARIVVVLALLAGLLGLVPGAAAVPAPVPTTGLSDTVAVAGLDPVEVAARLALVAFPGGADRVLLARSDRFPDALAGGLLQGGAPLLLTGSTTPLAPALVDALGRLGASEAVVLGGPAAVPDAVVAEVAGLGLATSRVAGGSRVETAAELARRFAPAASTVVVARAGASGDPTQAFVDALAAGALSAANGWPVLLTDTAALSAPTRAVIAELPVTEVVIVGGAAAVSDAVEAELAQLAAVRRLAGPTRYATAAAVARERGVGPASGVVLVDGTAADAWVAGFTAAAFAARTPAPLLLSAGPELPAETLELLVGGSTGTLVCGAPTGACEQARAVLGRPAPSRLLTDPGPEGLLSGVSALTVTAEGGDRTDAVTLSGTCVGGTVAQTLAGGQTVVALDPARGPVCDLVIALELAGGVVQTASATYGRVVVAGAEDFASHRHGDPWDYANTEDVHLDRGPTLQVANPRLEFGELRYTAQTGFVHLLWPVFAGGIPNGRDGVAAPLDADRYQGLALRLWLSTAASIQLVWQTCAVGCEQSVTLNVPAGWQTLDLRPGWTGAVVALRLAIGGTIDVRVDWARAYVPVPAVPLGVAGPLFWDVDADPANNTPDAPGWGPVPSGGAGAEWPGGAMPPGDYFLHDAAFAYVGAVRVVPPPQLVVDDPEAGGGEDYAATHVGDPWDFTTADDLARLGNARDPVVVDGVLSATNTSNDPFVELRMGGPLDPAHYHRLTVRFANDGPLDLGFAPGGGGHGRLLWGSGNGLYADGREIIAYPNAASYTIDLAEVEGARWLAAAIGQVRFDPNEDPAARRWHLDEVALRADDASPGSFVVRWHDTSDAAGLTTTVDVAADVDRAGFDGVPIASGVTGGSATWSTCGVAPGTYWIHLTARRGGTTVQRYADGPLQVTNTSC